jgi:hypothetical protein
LGPAPRPLPRTLDRRLDDEVGGAADQDEVLGVVAAHEDETAAAVDRHGVDDGEARHATAPDAAEATGGVSPHQPVDHRDQGQNDHDRDGELHDPGAPVARH